MKWKIAIAVIIVAVSYSCTKNNQKVAAEVLIKKWTGKQIQLSNSFACRWQNSDTSLCVPLLDSHNKVLAIGNPALNPKVWELAEARETIISSLRS